MNRLTAVSEEEACASFDPSTYDPANRQTIVTYTMNDGRKKSLKMRRVSFDVRADMDRVVEEDDGQTVSISTPRSDSRSPGPRVTVAPRKGSFENRASFRAMHIPQTEAEKKKVNPQKRGPASRTTVITVAGLFTVGLMFILSGFIVLVTPNNNVAPAMKTTGWVFLGFGIFMLVVCGIVQRKNWVRYMDQMDEDLYFLRLGSNPVWKLMKIDLLDIATMGYQTRKAQTQASLHVQSETTPSPPREPPTSSEPLRPANVNFTLHSPMA